MKLAEDSLCSGCAACYAICPHRAISMRADSEGFLHPFVNHALCVECGLCERVCPSLHPAQPRKPLGVYAANAKDDAIRVRSSSGGIFSLIAKQTLGRRGVVFGAVFDPEDWHVYHKSIEREEDLYEICGSKYVQSEIGDSYHQVEEFLQSGRPVLFSGTPCQVAGLKHYLLLRPNVHSEGLLTVDVVCHAVPSPLAWRKYLEARVGSAYNPQADLKGRIVSIAFRCKDFGWKRFSMALLFANGIKYLKEFGNDTFMRGFLSELFNRTSCCTCTCRNLCSGSDLTLADYWNVHTRFPDMDDDKGTSLLLINTGKGAAALKLISEGVSACESTYDHACKTNPPIIYSKKPHHKRGEFFRHVSEREFDAFVNRLIQPSVMRRMRSWVGRMLNRIGRSR